MKTPPADLLPLIEAAAWLRAAGHTWAHVADDTGRAPETCRKWPREYPRLWADAWAAGMAEVLREAAAEAVLTLRNLLRSKSERVQLQAAKVLVEAATESRAAAAKKADRQEVPADIDPRLFADAIRVAYIIKDAWYDRHPEAAAEWDEAGAPAVAPGAGADEGDRWRG